MAVFFNKKAETFDPAPFRMTASDVSVATLKAHLAKTLGINFSDSDLNGFTSTVTRGNTGVPIFVTDIRGESNVKAYAVTGVDQLCGT